MPLRMPRHAVAILMPITSYAERLPPPLAAMPLLLPIRRRHFAIRAIDAAAIIFAADDDAAATC